MRSAKPVSAVSAMGGCRGACRSFASNAAGVSHACCSTVVCTSLIIQHDFLLVSWPSLMQLAALRHRGAMRRS